MADLKIEASNLPPSAEAFGAKVEQDRLLLPAQTARLMGRYGIQTSGALLAVSGSQARGVGDLLGLKPDEVLRQRQQLAALVGEPSPTAAPKRAFAFGALPLMKQPGRR